MLNGDSKLGALDRLAKISGLIALFGGLVYALGFVALCVPLQFAYGMEFNEAWYAASLVPNVGIAGHGVRQLLLGPLPYVLVAIPAFLRLLFHRFLGWTAYLSGAT
jgi:hypothetical protein